MLLVVLSLRFRWFAIAVRSVDPLPIQRPLTIRTSSGNHGRNAILGPGSRPPAVMGWSRHGWNVERFGDVHPFCTPWLGLGSHPETAAKPVSVDATPNTQPSTSQSKESTFVFVPRAILAIIHVLIHGKYFSYEFQRLWTLNFFQLMCTVGFEHCNQ